MSLPSHWTNIQKGEKTVGYPVPTGIINGL